jgi:hypothetical protein
LIVVELAEVRDSLKKRLMAIPFLQNAGVGRGITLITFAIVKIQLLLKIVAAIGVTAAAVAAIIFK